MVGGELKCNILFFAAAAQAMDCRKQEITIASGTTVGDAFDSLADSCEQLAALSSICALAVDGQLAKRDTQLHDDCTIAILPPVSGG